MPALDSVLFLSPRGSQVDVVQSVGRVMRKAPGKDLGYIILPVVVPSGMTPEQALSANKPFEVVWQVLNALRAHDDRFTAMVNQIELNTKRPKQIGIGHVGPTDRDDVQLELSFDIEGWRDAIYARIVKKVGERRYWQTWAKDIAEIAQQHITRINGLLADTDSNAAKEFDAFLDGLRGNLNDGITQADAVDMLAQHLITRPVFEALFAGYDFAASNPVAQTMERMLAVLDEHALDDENASLEKFYDSVRARVEGIDNAEGRQKIIVELYDTFFATAFKKTVDKLGIVYTPVEIVDFILHSADDLLREHFGQGLTDEGVHVLDGFTGTGTFMTRLLQLGLIEPHDLARKYANELHANEMLLLAYYIAAVNIETTYQDLRRGTLEEGEAEYESFEGLVLTDTFQSYEDSDEDDLGVFPVNNERLNRQRQLPITVIVGNPPYSSGQDSANDNNANEKYPALDTSIRDTYAARSTANMLYKLYDSYIRAIKWASLRIADRGVIAYVTNGGWLDSNTADGMRLSLAEEFSDIYIYNLRGNQRTAGEESRKEGGKIFGGGSRATVAITLLVKDPAHDGPATVHYTDIGDYLTRDEKLAKVAEGQRVTALERVDITPNEHGDWLNQRRDDFHEFLPLQGAPPGIFALNSLGVGTNRDPWVYASSRAALLRKVSRHVDAYEHERALWAARDRSDARTIEQFVQVDETKASWGGDIRKHIARGRALSLDETSVRLSCYRPFTRQLLYLDRTLNNRMAAQADLFPAQQHPNYGFITMAPRVEARPALLMIDSVPDLSYYTYTGQFFARWRYEPVETSEGMLDLDSASGDGEVIDGYRKIDNITEEALVRFQDAYGESFTKDDIFFYVYGLLHSQDYRDTYAADLKKSLPRVPLVSDHVPFVRAGRKLSQLHLDYESAAPFALDGLAPDQGNADPYEFYRVEKMKFAKVRDPETNKLVGDKSTVVYNSRITLSGIPEGAYRYMLGSRSAIEWIIDRYQVKTDKASGIVNDPNDWSKEVEDPRYIIDLLARIVTVSLETMKLVDALPPLQVQQ